MQRRIAKTFLQQALQIFLDAGRFSLSYALKFGLRLQRAVGMKVEWKLSDFSAEKQKRNDNMEMETEFCGTKMETEIL
jgi:hypothetical protein